MVHSIPHDLSFRLSCLNLISSEMTLTPALRKIHQLQVTIMKASTIKPIAFAFLLSNLFAASVSFAQSSTPSSVNAFDGQHYDSTTGHRASSARIDTESSTAVGPYGKYLINTGMSRDDALKAAHSADQRQQGTPAIVIVNKPTASQPGPYAKYLMHVGLSQEEAVAAASNIDQREAAVAHSSIRSTQGERNVIR